MLSVILGLQSTPQIFSYHSKEGGNKVRSVLMIIVCVYFFVFLIWEALIVLGWFRDLKATEEVQENGTLKDSNVGACCIHCLAVSCSIFAAAFLAPVWTAFCSNLQYFSWLPFLPNCFNFWLVMLHYPVMVWSAGFGPGANNGLDSTTSCGWGLDLAAVGHEGWGKNHLLWISIAAARCCCRMLLLSGCLPFLSLGIPAAGHLLPLPGSSALRLYSSLGCWQLWRCGWWSVWGEGVTEW